MWPSSSSFYLFLCMRERKLLAMGTFLWTRQRERGGGEAFSKMNPRQQQLKHSSFHRLTTTHASLASFFLLPKLFIGPRFTRRGGKQEVFVLTRLSFVSPTTFGFLTAPLLIFQAPISKDTQHPSSARGFFFWVPRPWPLHCFLALEKILCNHHLLRFLCLLVYHTWQWFSFSWP